jgi:hypothetical protein
MTQVNQNQFVATLLVAATQVATHQMQAPQGAATQVAQSHRAMQVATFQSPAPQGAATQVAQNHRATQVATFRSLAPQHAATQVANQMIRAGTTPFLRSCAVSQTFCSTTTPLCLSLESPLDSSNHQPMPISSASASPAIRVLRTLTPTIRGRPRKRAKVSWVLDDGTALDVTSSIETLNRSVMSVAGLQYAPSTLQHQTWLIARWHQWLQQRKQQPTQTTAMCFVMATATDAGSKKKYLGTLLKSLEPMAVVSAFRKGLSRMQATADIEQAPPLPWMTAMEVLQTLSARNAAALVMGMRTASRMDEIRMTMNNIVAIREESVVVWFSNSLKNTQMEPEDRFEPFTFWVVPPPTELDGDVPQLLEMRKAAWHNTVSTLRMLRSHRHEGEIADDRNAILKALTARGYSGHSVKRGAAARAAKKIIVAGLPQYYLSLVEKHKNKNYPMKAGDLRYLGDKCLAAEFVSLNRVAEAL